MLWWKDHGPKFPRVFPSAIVWLGKPSTNAFQECVFSSSSWFDSNRLMRKQSAKTFEMRTLEMLTRQVRKEIIAAEVALANEEKERNRSMFRQVIDIEAGTDAGMYTVSGGIVSEPVVTGLTTEPTLTMNAVNEDDNDSGDGKPSVLSVTEDSAPHIPTDEEDVVENIINLTETMEQFKRDRDPTIDGQTTVVEFIEGDDEGVAIEGEGTPILSIVDDVVIINITKEDGENNNAASNDYFSDREDDLMLVATLRDELHTLEDCQLEKMGRAPPKDSPPKTTGSTNTNDKTTSVDDTHAHAVATTDRAMGTSTSGQTSFADNAGAPNSGQKLKATLQSTLKKPPSRHL